MLYVFTGVIITACVPPDGYRVRNSKQYRSESKTGHSRSYKNSYESYYFHNKQRRYTGRKHYSGYSSKLSSGARARIIATAKRYLGVKYRYGGTTPRGFDCSGLVMYVFRKNGIKISRSAKRQFYRGKRVYLKRAKPGDLVFFQTSRYKRISHVGIYLGNYRFIHAPRTGKRVSYASIRTRYWRKRLVGVVRYL